MLSGLMKGLGYVSQATLDKHIDTIGQVQREADLYMRERDEAYDDVKDLQSQLTKATDRLDGLRELNRRCRVTDVVVIKVVNPNSHKVVSYNVNLILNDVNGDQGSIILRSRIASKKHLEELTTYANHLKQALVLSTLLDD